MTSQKVYAHNILTDVIKPVPAHYLDHPILGANLVKVRNGKTRGRLSEIVETIHAASNTDTEEAAGPPTEPVETDVLADKKED